MARARLGFALQDLRGRVGEQVVTRTRAGLALRSRARYKFHVTPAFGAASQRLRRANEAWNTLSAAEVEAWWHYADTLRRVDRVTGQEYSPTAKNVFVGLASKVSQVDPLAPVPRVPPAAEFLGDTVGLTVTGVPGGARFTAGAANGADTTTEILVQRLANVRRRPTGRYVHGAFHTFTPGSLSYDLPLAPGVYALAFRFVRPSTGEMSGLRRLGVVEV
ncbi:MAG: hypothetical protein KF733_03540 [Fimbriimonadaceae bacterium]|nr:MAG: hypothetical protein KF733_03540 [Fimbriimonadaceae bacterium]